MDRGWMIKPRSTTAYKDGVEQFLSFSFRDVPLGDKILCPCVNCGNKATQNYDEVKTHLRCDGILQGYTKCVCHGEEYDSPSFAFSPMSNNNSNFHIPGFPMNSDVEGSNRRLHDIQGMLSAIFPMADSFQSLSSSSDGELDGVQSEFENLEPGVAENVSTTCADDDTMREQDINTSFLEEANTDLYPGCAAYSRLSFLVTLYHMKVLHGWTHESFTQLLGVLPVAFPQIILPKKYYEVKNSGVVNIAENKVSYFGRLSDIFELSYRDYKVVFFKCDWYDVHHKAGIIKDEFGFTHVNFSRKIHTGERLEDDPFVFSSQVEQVFYIQNPRSENWNTMVKFKPRDIFDMGEEPSSDETN